MKDKEVHGLMKIPSEVVIKELRQELGKLKSDIEELKYNIEKFRNLNADLILHGFKKSSEIIMLKSEIERLETEIKRHQKANTKLHRSLFKLKNKTDETVSLQRSQVS